MISLVLGYTPESWDEIYRAYFYEYKEDPGDLFELLTYWRSKPKDTPNDCIKIAALLAQKTDIDVAPVREMIRKFYSKLGINLAESS